VVCVPDAFAGPADPKKNSTGSFACVSSRRYAMLNAATCQMTTDNNPMRSTYGRAGFQPRRKRMLLRITTACACLAASWRAALSAQLLPYDVDPKRESDLQPLVRRSMMRLRRREPPNSNRSRYRLEINISPTKQRTEALSNRS
jgi:hypothetical protein